MTRSVDPQRAARGALGRARALADPTRVRILELVAEAGRPVTVYDLAAVVGLHHTAVRQHLAKLRSAGLIDEEPLPPTGRGRPRLAYRTVGSAPAGGPYQVLARLLAEAVRTGRSPRDTGRAAGERMAIADGAAVDQVVREASRIGFEPVVHHRRSGVADVVLRACPFADVADADPQTVCDLHLGLAEGLVGAVGDATVEGLHLADPHRGGCRLTIRHA